MIFKNFWAHRKQNGWLFVEIVLISVLSFYSLDHAVVAGYDTYLCRAKGEFEKKHLLIGYVDHVHGIPLPDDIFAPLYALRDHIRNMPEVESVCMSNSFIGDYAQYYSMFELYVEADTTRKCVAFHHQFIVGEHFFETHGLTTATGSPTAEKLSAECPEDGVVISRSLALALFDTDQVVGRRVVLNSHRHRYPMDEKDERHCKIAGVTEDVKAIPTQRYFYSLFTTTTLWDNSPCMLIRLKPGVDVKAFVEQHNQPDGIITEGSQKLVQLKTFDDYQKDSPNITDQYVILNIIGLFLGLFLVNVVLGTLGTFWLQLRKRTEDIGIMRSFGAKRRNIFGMVWKEVALLTLIACIIGWIIWLQFAFNIGVAKGMSEVKTGLESDWVNTFWLHYGIICLIQYILLLTIVTIGMITPSLIAMYKKPVNALRYE